MPELRRDFRGSLTELSRPRVTFEGRVARLHTPTDPLVYDSGPEHRDAAELQRIVDQLPGLTVTLMHPPGMVADGAPAKVVGRVVSARVDGEYAVAEIEVDGLTNVDEIREDAHELSLGYRCELDADRYQRNTQLDHLSFVPRARCGETCAVRTDEVAQIEVRHVPCTCEKRANCYADLYMDELKTQLAAAIEAATAEKTRADAAEKRANEEKSRADAAVASASQAEIDRDNAKRELTAETTRADAAVEAAKVDAAKAREDAMSASTVAVAARVKLLTEANKVLGETDDRTALSDRDIKVAVIKHVDGDDVPSEKPDMYVDGIYDGALRRHAKGYGSHVDAVVAITQMRQDGAAAVAAAADPMAREKVAQAALKRSMSNAWLKKTQE